MGLFDVFKRPPQASPEEQAATAQRQAEISAYVHGGNLPSSTRERLQAARSGAQPWIATLTPAELLIARSHGIRPISTVSATCWLHYGWSWTLGHAEGWNAALRRLRDEAQVAGANAVLDVKMRTVPLGVANSMDFTLVGTAVRIEGLPPNPEPLIATVPALEFVRLLEADVVPTGIAIGADYQWLPNTWNATKSWMGNVESRPLSNLWEGVRQAAHADLRKSAQRLGNGVLAHINFSQIYERKGPNDTEGFIARHIVIATTVDARRGAPIPHDVGMVVDMHAGGTPLTGTTRHHQSYASNDEDGAI
jgi:uncharacterized protein YbjQ (UPF0145 family)